MVSVPHVLLALLSEGPKYGLQLREEFEAGTGEVWPLNVGQVYKTLGRLERDGLAESDGAGQDGPQKRYRITADGREALAAIGVLVESTFIPGLGHGIDETGVSVGALFLQRAFASA